jgi:CRP/FNR family cyclic AMP-dependent transcriptional regulator
VEELIKLSKLATLRAFPKKALLFFQDDPIHNIYILIQGSIKLYKSGSNGKEFIIEIIRPSEIFPLEYLFQTEKYSIYAEIIENATVIMIPLSKFNQFIIQNETLCINTITYLSEQLFDLYDRLGEKILFTIWDQILLLLLRLGKKYGKVSDKNWLILDTYISNKDLASMIGTSRETMNRSLSELIQKDIIKYDDQHILMINEKKAKFLLPKSKLGYDF